MSTPSLNDAHSDVTLNDPLIHRGPTNVRPLSLINVDTGLYIQSAGPIHTDEVGFEKSRSCI